MTWTPQTVDNGNFTEVAEIDLHGWFAGGWFFGWFEEESNNWDRATISNGNWTEV